MKSLDSILTSLENSVQADIKNRLTNSRQGKAPKQIHWEAKQEIKSLFMEIVGEDEVVPNKEINQEATDVIDAITRDQLRAELRKKIESL